MAGDSGELGDMWGPVRPRPEGHEDRKDFKSPVRAAAAVTTGTRTWVTALGDNGGEKWGKVEEVRGRW